LRSNDIVGNVIDQYTGQMSAPQFIADIFKNMGYDGIIMDAYSHFGPQKWGGGITKGMPNLHPDTNHYFVWDKNQIKSAIGNNGIYDPENPKIIAFNYNKWIK
jgi:hypothetical protein